MSLLAVLALALVLSAACLAALWAFGLVDFPFLNRALPPASLEGYARVPVSSQFIPAFTKLNRNYISDPKTGKVTYIPVPQDKLSPGTILDPEKIVNRVMSRDKLPAHGFTEGDFLPEGTRPGITGGTPPGKRAVTLSVEHLSGFDGLKSGDRVDLLATVPIETLPPTGQVGLQAKELVVQAEYAKMRKRASVRVLAEDAVVVSPLHTRERPITSTTLMGGTQTRTVPVQEVVIAVNPDEVAKVGEAQGMHLDIDVVVRSGRPDDPDKSVPTPGADPLSDAPVQIVETITGSKRDTQVFTAPSVRVLAPVKAPAVVVPAQPAVVVPLEPTDTNPVDAQPRDATPAIPAPTGGAALQGTRSKTPAGSPAVQPAGGLSRDGSPFGDEDPSTAAK